MDKEEWFKIRTNRHIGLMRKYTNRVAKLELPGVDRILLLKEGKEHDSTKFNEPEYTPYLEITWRYREARHGRDYEVSKEIESDMLKATFHHITHNKHHPEYWSNAMISCLNSENRDKPAKIVDATGMPLTYIAAMMADWLAMSEEKNSSIDGWIKMNVGIRWEFSKEAVSLIHEIVSLVEVDALLCK